MSLRRKLENFYLLSRMVAEAIAIGIRSSRCVIEKERRQQVASRH
ncbi:hypothetical protein [Chroococcidiopsis sp.]